MLGFFPNEVVREENGRINEVYLPKLDSDTEMGK